MQSCACSVGVNPPARPGSPDTTVFNRGNILPKLLEASLIRHLVIGDVFVYLNDELLTIVVYMLQVTLSVKNEAGN